MSTARDVTAGTAGSADVFETHRPHLRALAYRMLGSMTDADDVLQDAWLRWTAADRSGVRTPAAFLTRTVTNLCLTALTSARARREVYVGPWLPEPVVIGSLLAADVVSRADGGGAVRAAARPVVGREAVARYLVGVLARWGTDVLPVLVEANGGPAMVAVQGGRVTAVCFLAFDAAGTLRALDIVLHPDKIAFAAAQLSDAGLSHPGGLPGQEG